MTRSRLVLVCTLSCTALPLAAPAAAGAAWTAPQTLLGAPGFGNSGVAVASNARGDAVTASSHASGISVARASAGQPFGAAVRISAEGNSPRVAIDERGVVLIAFEYFDEFFQGSDGFRGTITCCVGTKVVVWRPGHAPTGPRVVRRVGLVTRAGPVAAAGGRRGLLVYASDSKERVRPLQFVPIRIDGRPGKRRNVARRHWAGGSLQYVGGRAVVGLIGTTGPTRLAVRRQGRAGTFGALRAFLRLPRPLTHHIDGADYAEILMTPDGRGGQVIAWQGGQRPRNYMRVARKPLRGRLRIVDVRRGRAEDLDFAAPSVSRDGWIAVAFTRKPRVTSSTAYAYLVAISPGGRAIVTPLTGAGYFSGPVASVTLGGAGVVGFTSSIYEPGGPLGSSSFVPLVRGRPRPAEALGRISDNVAVGAVVVTSNPRDRGRVVWEEISVVAPERAGVLASRLE